MSWFLYPLLFLALATLVISWLAYLASRGQKNSQEGHQEKIIRLDGRLEEQGKHFSEIRNEISQFAEKQATILESLKISFEKRQQEALQMLQLSLQSGQESSARQLTESLSKSATDLGKRVEDLTHKTDLRLQEISGQVEKRLSEGFEKTTATFTDVLKRLALIDEAQKKITELSSNVVSLQHVLSDKKSRGAFGEVQLTALVRNVLPESAFSFQHTLRNGSRVDCLLFLPAPTGNVAIDAKFPLESYQRMLNPVLGEAERKAAESQFKTDIKKHLHDIAEKYIVSGETSDGAIMFLPAEAVFAEIHAHHPDLVDLSHRTRVWFTSPTTLVAILNTARAVLKDAATREQVHVIQEHLVLLGKDFQLFQERMEALAKNVRQANDQADKLSISARKITGHFQKIERAELKENPEFVLEEKNGS